MPKTDWECFKIALRPAGTPGPFKVVWAVSSGSTLSMLSPELCEILHGQFGNTSAPLKDISKDPFLLPVSAFDLVFLGQIYPGEPFGVAELLRKNAGVDLMASRALSNLARQAGLTRRWGDLPPDDRPAIYPRPPNHVFVSFTDWASPDKPKGENPSEDEGGMERKMASKMSESSCACVF